MKAVAVFPGKANSIHLADIPEPRLADVPGGRGVIVEVSRVGVDGTDKEINNAAYGAAPPGSDLLVIGHESFGRVLKVGANVTEFQPGDLVVAMVRRPGGSIYDAIGAQDLTSDTTYFERGINLLHGFLTERYVDEPEYLVRVPEALADVAALMEPVSVAEKAIRVAEEAQRRLQVWKPRRALILGAGTLGLLTTLMLRLRGLATVTMARSEPPTPNSQLVEAIGGTYLSLRQVPMQQAAEQHGPFDLIVEAAGVASVMTEAIGALGTNGALVLTGLPGEGEPAGVSIDALKALVLGNKLVVGSVNAHRRDFERGIADLALAQAQYPGWLERLLTHRVDGLDNYREMIRLLTEEKGVIKVYVEVQHG